jgi:hypothetical protein
MMASTTNILTQVQTYQRASLALLQNQSPLVATANTKFKDFEKITANLGSSVTFDLPPRFTTAIGLVASFQPAVQRIQTLTCDQAANTSYEFTAQERIFNVEKDVDSYMEVFGKSAVAELSNQIEANLALNSHSAVPVNQIVNGQTQPTGALHTESGPFRFFGDGVTPINSYQQLAQMVSNFKNFGAVREGIKVYLYDLMIPAIVGSGLNQFVPQRNDDIAMSWEVGTFGTPPVSYYMSNLLPIHTSGNVGNQGRVLTVVSTNDPTGANVTQITFSDPTATDANSVFSGDLFQFQDGVSGQPNMRFLTFIGHVPSGQPVQFRATANAATSGNSITVNIFPALSWIAGQNQNLNNPIAAGMQVKAVPTHRAGLVVGGSAFYVAMPQLPNEDPFPSANEYDHDTAVSLRMYYGSLFGQNQRGMIHDCTWGSTLVPEYSMRICIPV